MNTHLMTMSAESQGQVSTFTDNGPKNLEIDIERTDSIGVHETSIGMAEDDGRIMSCE